MGKQKKKLKTYDDLPNFEEILVNATDIDDRTKSLWVQIYNNACNDRERVAILYNDIFSEVKGNNQGHAVYGPLVTKYLEKMAKANDQLLKLSELIASYRKAEGTIDPDDLLDEIQGQLEDS
jgi:hypothetical protein